MNYDGLELGPGEKISIIHGKSSTEYHHDQLILPGILIVCAFFFGCWVWPKLRSFWRRGATERHEGGQR